MHFPFKENTWKTGPCNCTGFMLPKAPAAVALGVSNCPSSSVMELARPAAEARGVLNSLPGGLGWSRNANPRMVGIASKSEDVSVSTAPSERIDNSPQVTGTAKLACNCMTGKHTFLLTATVPDCGVNSITKSCKTAGIACNQHTNASTSTRMLNSSDGFYRLR